MLVRSPGPSVPDPGVKESVEYIDSEVDEYVEAADQNYHGLDYGIVARGYRLDGQPPQARDSEHALGHDRP